jgi:hypothetical protein
LCQLFLEEESIYENEDDETDKKRPGRSKGLAEEGALEQNLRIDPGSGIEDEKSYQRDRDEDGIVAK